MIYPSLRIIAEQLNTHIFEKWGATINGTGEIVELNNIAEINEEKNDLQNKIILTLLKTEEESTLKNGAFYLRKAPQEIIKHHPAVYLNLYLLVSVTKKDYREALQLLSDTITFFQSHKVFSGQSSDNGSGPAEGPAEEYAFRIIVELYNFNFQEIFDMWSNLGSKHFPSTIYKVRLLNFLDSQEQKEAHVIENINIDTE